MQQSVLNFPNPKAEPAQPALRPEPWYDFEHESVDLPRPPAPQASHGERKRAIAAAVCAILAELKRA